ncbi:MAG: IS256 family transposase [Selenomonadaceae bacterium]
MRNKSKETPAKNPSENFGLDEILREGARKMLQAAIEAEIEEYMDKRRTLVDADGKQLVTRNGYMPERIIHTGIGPLPVKRPRVDDRMLDQDNRFASIVLPKYIRRTPNIDSLIPLLYLKGVSTNDFPSALSALIGEGAKGFSSSTIVRLKQIWEEEYEAWSKRDLTGKQYAYFWVDGIHFNVRLDDDKSCILVIIGADSQGNKELIAVSDGHRESKISWKELLLELRNRGLIVDPKLVIGDGALGFWAAAREAYCATTREQRCWVHKTANILDKMPKSLQGKAKSMIHEMYMSDTKVKALKAYDHFIETYSGKYPKAVECLTKDKEHLFTFYDFPAVHWQHIRTTNPIESTFATIRLRTQKTRGCGSRTATLTMVYKLAMEAEKGWKKLKGYKMILLVLENRKFIDGELEEAA